MIKKIFVFFFGKFFSGEGGSFFQKVAIFTKKREKNVFIFKIIKNGPNNPKFYQNELLAIIQLFYRTECWYFYFSVIFWPKFSKNDPFWPFLVIFLPKKAIILRNRQNYENSAIKKVSKIIFRNREKKFCT